MDSVKAAHAAALEPTFANRRHHRPTRALVKTTNGLDRQQAFAHWQLTSKGPDLHIHNTWDRL